MIHAPTMPQQKVPAKTDSKDKSEKHVRMIQHRGDTVAGRLVGLTFIFQGAAQPMHEECQGSRS